MRFEFFECSQTGKVSVRLLVFELFFDVQKTHAFFEHPNRVKNHLFFEMVFEAVTSGELTKTGK